MGIDRRGSQVLFELQPCSFQPSNLVILEADAGIWSEFTDSGQFVATKGVRLRHPFRRGSTWSKWLTKSALS